MMPLSSLKAWDLGVVHDITGEQGFISRITAIGFTKNAEVTMVRNWKWGPLIVFVRDTKMALGRSEAEKIMVRKNVK